AAQNLINPVGSQKIDRFEYTLQLNNAPTEIKALGDLPIKAVNGAMVYIRDVAQVRDGNPPQTNIVQVNGARSGLLSVLKNGSVSTLAIIDGVKARLEEIKPSLPEALKIDLLADQSLFVRSAVVNVVHEGILAAVLTSVMILLFLGSWRSTVIIAISIPLSVLAAIASLAAIGETLNIMTLGGLALAVGILVDEATVTIENINAHLERGQDVRTAIIDASDEIATPAFVSMLCVCIVFLPMFFLEGIAKFLFVPMAEAVMFAMAFSFLLSRTLVPTLAIYLLREHQHEDAAKAGFFTGIHHRFNAGFDAFRDGYIALLAGLLTRPRTFCLAFMLIGGLSFLLVPYLGRNFFPKVDGGQILIHVRADVGTRVEETARQLAKVEAEIRGLIPEEEIQAIVNNIGIPISGINLSYNNTGVIGPQDGDIQIALARGHKPTPDYVTMLRDELPKRFPSMTFSFLPADIVSQILNFGAPSPIDIQIKGGKLAGNFEFAGKVVRAISQIPGIADVRIQQSASYPAFKIDVDRSQAQTVGISERDVANSLGVSLAGTSQVAPTFWLNPANGVSYPIAIQTPQYRVDSLASLKNVPINTAGRDNNQVLGALASVERTKLNAIISQTDIQPM
ncbi:MAG TPA: efflux RND transporter permease subunit, partial [Hyphomicrobium sp.]|nr:efflux RND transporter permease subunit [Hyphomicrobium sp.]